MASTFDAVVLGGGPSGSTVATLLSQAGRRVVVLERDRFPRFHIGESLLPASVRIYDRLGVHDRIRQTSIYKPGGKWLYGPHEVPGDFSRFDRWAAFKSTPFAYLVERSVFDEILLQRSAACGADVRFDTEVSDVLMEGERVVGVRARTRDGQPEDFRGRLVFDATGLRAFLGSKLQLRRPTVHQRMGIYAHYRSDSRRADCDNGWFLGQMFYDGWTWLLRLPENRFSVGVVLSMDRFRRSELSPTQLLERLVQENPLLRDGMTPDAERISDVYVTGNMGNTCSRLAGEGWVMVGDAGFFIDPCYSSGVHIAMESAERAADLFLAQPEDRPIPASAYARYERRMKSHEAFVTRMVEAFYIASRNTAVQKMIVALQKTYLSRRFVTFVGGDFSKNHHFMYLTHVLSQLVASLFPNDATRAPENHPEYLHAATTSLSAATSAPAAEMPPSAGTQPAEQACA
jgi:flavin-dependent dehydrogenase